MSIIFYSKSSLLFYIVNISSTVISKSKAGVVLITVFCVGGILFQSYLQDRMKKYQINHLIQTFYTQLHNSSDVFLKYHTQTNDEQNQQTTNVNTIKRLSNLANQLKDSRVDCGGLLDGSRTMNFGRYIFY